MTFLDDGTPPSVPRADAASRSAGTGGPALGSGDVGRGSDVEELDPSSRRPQGCCFRVLWFYQNASNRGLRLAEGCFLCSYFCATHSVLIKGNDRLPFGVVIWDSLDVFSFFCSSVRHDQQPPPPAAASSSAGNPAPPQLLRPTH